MPWQMPSQRRVSHGDQQSTMSVPDMVPLIALAFLSVKPLQRSLAMQRVNRVISMALVLSMAFAAARAQAAAGWTSYGEVTELQVTEFGRILVRLKLKSTPTDCRDKQWYFRDQIVGSELMYRLLLEAASTGRRVRVYATGRCDLNQYSEISRVGMRP